MFKNHPTSWKKPRKFRKIIIFHQLEWYFLKTKCAWFIKNGGKFPPSPEENTEAVFLRIRILQTPKSVCVSENLQGTAGAAGAEVPGETLWKGSLGELVGGGVFTCIVFTLTLGYFWINPKFWWTWSNLIWWVYFSWIGWNQRYVYRKDWPFGSNAVSSCRLYFQIIWWKPWFSERCEVSICFPKFRFKKPQFI